jgi:hypothetical protein
MFARDIYIRSHEWGEAKRPNADGVLAGLKAGNLKRAVGTGRRANDEARIRGAADTDLSGRDRLATPDRNDAAADFAPVRRGGLRGVRG